MMIVNTTNKTGFTIVELLIVMAIIGILIPLGVNSFISMRRSREVSEAASNTRDLIKTARSMSLSVSSPPNSTDWPVAYEVIISSSGIVTNVKSVSAGLQHSNWDSSEIYNNYELSTLDLGAVEISSSGCNRVVFSSVNGEMFIYSDGNYADLLTECAISFTLEDKMQTLILNSSNKTFEIQ